MKGLDDWDPPKKPNGDEDAAVITAFSIVQGERDWDPPLRASNRRGSSPAHLVSGGLVARELVGAKLDNRPTTWPPKLDDLDVEQRLALVDLRVRVQLALAELVPKTRLEATLNAKQNATEFRLYWGASTDPMLRMTRPGRARLLDSMPYTDRQGIAGVEAAMPQRRLNVDSILAADQDLDLHFMEAMAIPVVRYPCTFTLLRVALAWTTFLVQSMKHGFCVPRPHQLWSGATPVIEVPRHASYPGGHAAQSRAAAMVLTRLAHGSTEAGPGLRRLADKIADHRVVAGLHYPIDSLAGQTLGGIAAAVLSGAEGASGMITSVSFEADRAGNEAVDGPGVTLNFDGLVLPALWRLARLEWQR